MAIDRPAGDGREYPERPVVGVGGLLFDGRAALLVRRGKEPGLGLWSIPGGGLKTGETLAEGLIREMAEETGLAVAPGPLVEVVERIFRDDHGRVRYHYVIFDYLCRIVGGGLEAGSDAAEVRFVPPEQWPDHNLPAITIQVLRKALNMNPAGPTLD